MWAFSSKGPRQWPNRPKPRPALVVPRLKAKVEKEKGYKIN